MHDMQHETNRDQSRAGRRQLAMVLAIDRESYKDALLRIVESRWRSQEKSATSETGWYTLWELADLHKLPTNLDAAFACM